MNTGSTDRAVDRVGAGLGVDVPQVDEEDAMVALNFSNVRRTAGFGGGAGGFWASTGAGNIARPATAYAMASRVMAVSVGAIKVIRSDDVQYGVYRPRYPSLPRAILNARSVGVWRRMWTPVGTLARWAA